MARRLRIAVSVFFALVAVAFCALWVRSYQHVDVGRFALRGNREFSLMSIYGSLFVDVEPINARPAVIPKVNSGPVTPLLVATVKNSPVLAFQSGVNSWNVRFHHWLPVAFSVVACAVTIFAPFRRFSLRSLLIATTIVAVLLGFVMWAIR
jgi:hypothetical protein